MRLFSLALATAVVATAFPSAPAAAVTTTYANFSQATGARLFRYAKLGSNGGTGNRLYTTAGASSNTAGEAAVDFKYLVAVPMAVQGIQDAFLTFDATTTEKIVANGDDRLQGGFSGVLSIRRATAVGGLDNLLTINFTNALLSNTQGGGSSTFQISIPAGGTTLVQSSDFLNFGTVLEANFALSFSGVNPAISTTNNTYGGAWRANGTGTFASNPAPTGIPEPETWGLMILGFGMVGIAVRRRRSVSRVAA